MIQKRSLTVMICMLLLALLLPSCRLKVVAPQETPSQEPPVATAAPEVTQEPVSTPSMFTTEEATPSVEDKVQAMQPIMDSIIRTMGVEGEYSYAPRDPEFFWTVLHLMAVNWGTTHSYVEIEDDGTIRAPRQVMQEFASAAFLDYDDLLPVPPQNAEILYDDAWDSYFFLSADAGDTKSSIEEIKQESNERLAVTVFLRDAEGDVLGSFVFILVPNPYLDGIVSPNYYYSIEAVK